MTTHTHMEVMVVHSAFEDAAKIVAIVDIPVEIEDDIQALEYAYRWTQNLHGSWSRGAEIDGQTNNDFNWRVKKIGDLPHIWAKSWAFDPPVSATT